MDKIQELKKIIPFKFRIWSWVWPKNKDWKSPKYSVLWYIDSRDAQERLDEIFWLDRSDKYKEIKGNLFCWVTIMWQTRRDCWVESKTEKDKWEASDAFKRACVKWWLGRFLYTLPRLVITLEEAEKNKYDITTFVRNKFQKELTDRHNVFIAKK